MFRPLNYLFERYIRTGHLRMADSTGRVHEFGDGTGSLVSGRICSRRTERQLAFNPTLAIGEAYMNGQLVFEQGTIYDFLELVLTNVAVAEQKRPPWLKAIETLRGMASRIEHYNPVGRSKRNVAHHYDIDGSLYDLFLDSDRQYSCAYFEDDDMPLEEAQLAKKRHIAAKLDLSDGMHVLDIGCGWGGLALYLAKTARVDVTGITLSEEQLKIARERASAAGLSNAVNFELCDYRKIEGAFDRIVSVGMFEHVGVAHYRQFFRQIDGLMADDGVALLHSIGQFDAPEGPNSFVTKYIFPGGYIPALSEVMRAVEREGLLTTDVEVLRLHYAMTLRHWRQRFRGAWHTAAERFGEKFCRMWEMYLAGAETGFRYQNLMVFQLQLAKDQSAVSLTRDYLFDRERQLRDHKSAEETSRNQDAT